MPELSERAKMILRLAGFGVLVVGLAAGMYFLFFRGTPDVEPPTQSTGGTQGTTGGLGLPSAGSSGEFGGGSEGGTGSGTGSLPSSPIANGGRTTVVTLTTSPVSAPTMNANGTVTYYDPADGKFYTIDKNGNVTALSDAQFPSAEAVTFSSSAKEAVVEFPDGTNVIYNLATSKQYTLPAHWEDFSFDASGTTVAGKSIATDPSARALVITAADGSSTKVVAPLGENDDLVDVNSSPDGSIIGFSKTGGSGSAFGQNEIFLIGADGQDSGVLIVNGTNFAASWSPDSSHLLYSVADASADYRPTLWYADKDGDRKGDARKQIALSTTVDKCTFASDKLAYCAAPADAAAGSGTSSALQTGNDQLYRVDLPTGRVTLLAIPSLNTQMSHLSVSAAGDLLYYTDRQGRLNYLRLK